MERASGLPGSVECSRSRAALRWVYTSSCGCNRVRARRIPRESVSRRVVQERACTCRRWMLCCRVDRSIDSSDVAGYHVGQEGEGGSDSTPWDHVRGVNTLGTALVARSLGMTVARCEVVVDMLGRYRAWGTQAGDSPRGLMMVLPYLCYSAKNRRKLLNSRLVLV